MSSPAVDPVVRRARVGVALLFLTNGAMLANLLPRYPEIKAKVGMDAIVYGLALAAFAAGAILVGLLAAMFIRWFGSARVALIGSILTALALLSAAVAPTAVLFALGLFIAGAVDSVTDVAQNAHSLRVQRAYDRSIINSFHAIWSIGAVLGGSMAAAAIALRVPIAVHLTVSTIVLAIVMIFAYRMCLPGPDEESGSDADARVCHCGRCIWSCFGGILARECVGEVAQVRVIQSANHEASIEESIELLTAGLGEEPTGVTRRKVAGVRPLPLLACIHTYRISRAPVSVRQRRGEYSPQVVRASHANKSAHRPFRVARRRVDQYSGHVPIGRVRDIQAFPKRRRAVAAGEDQFVDQEMRQRM